MNRPPVPSHGQSRRQNWQAKRTQETSFRGEVREEEEGPYANIDTTDIPESLKQKVNAARAKPGLQVAKRAAFFNVALQEENLPPPPPLPPLNFPTHAQQPVHSRTPEVTPELPPNHPSMQKDEHHESENESLEEDKPGRDYVDIGLSVQVPATPPPQRKPYPYEMTAVSKTTILQPPFETQSSVNAPPSSSTDGQQDPPPLPPPPPPFETKPAPVESAVPLIAPDRCEAPPHETIMNLEYESTFQEHKGAKLHPVCFKTIGRIYTCSILCMYHTLLFLLGLCTAICWGMIFGIVAFVHVWCFIPMSTLLYLCIRGVCPLLMEPLKIAIEIVSKACRVKVT